MKAVVLAAGYGTRLGGLTKDVPKPLLEVGGKAIIEHILDNLARSGCREVAVNLHYRGHQIRARLGDGARYGVRLVYSEEPELLGTAGGARQMAELLGARAEPVLVHYGDIVTDADLAALWRAHAAAPRARATVGLHRRAGSNSLVELDADSWIVRLVERGPRHEHEHFVHSGVSVVEVSLLRDAPEGPCDLPRDVFVPAVAAGQRLKGWELGGRRVAVDSEERLGLAREMWAP